MAELEDELGDIIGKARMGKGLAIDQLSQMTDLSSRYIERVEKYQENPDENRIKSLAEALDLDPEKLTDIAINAWQPAPVKLPLQNALVESFFIPYGAYGENCYVLGSTATSLAAVVDPGGETERIIDWLKEQNLRLDLVLVTHGHGDHVAGLRGLEAIQPTMRVSSHRYEYKSLSMAPTVIYEPVDKNDIVSLGNLEILTLHVPGHTPGSMAYYVGQVCFVGDTLFSGSIGRPKNHEMYAEMLTGIRSKILSLPDDTIILPGHGPATTVAEEKAHNPFF